MPHNLKVTPTISPPPQHTLEKTFIVSVEFFSRLERCTKKKNSKKSFVFSILLIVKRDCDEEEEEEEKRFSLIFEDIFGNINMKMLSKG